MVMPAVSVSTRAVLRRLVPRHGARPPPRQTLRQQGFGTGRSPGSSEFELSLGKIVDTLQADYPALFERSPNFDIYDECVVFELDLGNVGNAFEGRKLSALQGKRAYCRALLTLQRLAMKTVQDGKVKCSVQQWTPGDYTLRVNWTCNGMISAINTPLHISAISCYNIGAEASRHRIITPDPTIHRSLPTNMPSHQIERHKIEILEIHPPSLRQLLRRMWWNPQEKVTEPVMALTGQTSERIVAEQFSECIVASLSSWELQVAGSHSNIS